MQNPAGSRREIGVARDGIEPPTQGFSVLRVTSIETFRIPSVSRLIAM